MNALHLVASLFVRRPSCPHCGTEDVRPSQRPLLWARLVGLTTYRCRSCRRRFPMPRRFGEVV